MDGTIVVAGLQPGDDYSTLSAAVAATPSDITGTSGDYVIEARNDQIHARFTIPTILTNPTHYLVVRAFEGDETNGKGEGATIETTNSLGAIRGNSSTNYVEINGLYVNQKGSSRCVLLSGSHFTIKNCRLDSVSGDTVECVNGQGREATLDNNILYNATGAMCLDWSGGGDGLTRTINRVTAIGGTTRAFDRGGSTLAQERKEIYTNCLAFPNNGGDGFPTPSSSMQVFESDRNASSDASASANSITLGFDNRNITDDLVDPDGIVKDLNLKQSSGLFGAGINGSNIGAFLGQISKNISQSLSLNHENIITLKGIKNGVHALSVLPEHQLELASQKSSSENILITSANAIHFDGTKSSSQPLSLLTSNQISVLGVKQAYGKLSLSHNTSFTISGIADNIIRKSAILSISNNSTFSLAGSKSANGNISISQNSFSEINGFKASSSFISLVHTTTFTVSGIANSLIRKTGRIGISNNTQHSVVGRKSASNTIETENSNLTAMLGVKAAFGQLNSSHSNTIELFAYSNFAIPLVRSITIEGKLYLLQIPCNLDNTLIIEGKF